MLIQGPVVLPSHHYPLWTLQSACCSAQFDGWRLGELSVHPPRTR